MEIGALFPEHIVGFRAKGYYVALDDRFTEAYAYGANNCAKLAFLCWRKSPADALNQHLRPRDHIQTHPIFRVACRLQIPR